MRKIDLDSWHRRTHYELYRGMDFPHFSLTIRLDLTNFLPYIKERGDSFTVCMMYLAAKAANRIPEFRIRIREDAVIEHEVIHPSATILTDDELFTFCSVRYSEDFSVFAPRAAERIAFFKANPTLEDGDWQDSLLFMTSMPWIHFTSMHHPEISVNDSVPRVAWGKFIQEGDSIKMPLNVQAHHALIDGLHVGRFFETFQSYMDQPDEALSG
jgi:chloramphenicol O-acetyltransferase type A